MAFTKHSFNILYQSLGTLRSLGKWIHVKIAPIRFYAKRNPTAIASAWFLNISINILLQPCPDVHVYCSPYFKQVFLKMFLFQYLKNVICFAKCLNTGIKTWVCRLNENKTCKQRATVRIRYELQNENSWHVKSNRILWSWN